MTIKPPPADWIGSAETNENFALIHGMVMAPSFWRTYAPASVRRGHAIAYPLPGHHPWRLDQPGGDLTPPEVAKAYADAIRRDFNGKPVNLIGHSTGGFVSLLIARDYPELVRSVILIGGFACGRFEGQERLAARLLRIPRVGPFLFRQFFSRWIATPEQFRWGSIECVYDKACPWQDEQAVAALEEIRQQLTLARPEDIASCIRFMSGTPLLSDLARVTAPVLNLVGANDAIVPPAHQLRVSRLMPRVQTVILRDCGHLPMVEHQEQTSRSIGAFLSMLDVLDRSLDTPEITLPRQTAACNVSHLLNGAVARWEQTPSTRVQSAQDAMFHIGLGESPQ